MDAFTHIHTLHISNICAYSVLVGGAILRKTHTEPRLHDSSAQLIQLCILAGEMFARLSVMHVTLILSLLYGFWRSLLLLWSKIGLRVLVASQNVLILSSRFCSLTRVCSVFGLHFGLKWVRVPNFNCYCYCWCAGVLACVIVFASLSSHSALCLWKYMCWTQCGLRLLFNPFVWRMDCEWLERDGWKGPRTKENASRDL